MSSRALALRVLDRVARSELLHQVFADELAQVSLPARDRHLAQELSYGVTRLRLRYEAFINELAHFSVPEGSLRNIVLLGLHQLFALRLADHAAINETVELTRSAGMPGKAGFVNALLRSAQRIGEEELLARSLTGLSRLESLSVRYSHPSWVVSEYQEQLARCGLDDELEQALLHNNSLPRVQLAVANVEAQREVEAHSSTQASSLPGCITLEESLDFDLLNEAVWVQDLASQAVTRAFHSVIPEGALEVVDACAAPGGKSRLLRHLLPQQALLRSLDISAKRLEPLLKIASGGNWQVAAADFTEAQEGNADAVLIDAPCSSLGSVRRKPDTKYRSARGDLIGYAQQQAALLDAAWRSLKPLGIVGYATCTPTVTETDRVLRQAVKQGWIPIDTPAALIRVSNRLVISPRPNGAALLWGHHNQSDTMFLSLLQKPDNK